MKQKITKEQALKIAETDYYDGVMSAIEKLNEMGFETPIYWAWLKQTVENNQDIDWFNMNCNCRDLQFQALGIYEIMQRAYDEVWES
jgi:hypothetical protein